jgi:hypothetical protein
LKGQTQNADESGGVEIMNANGKLKTITKENAGWKRVKRRRGNPQFLGLDSLAKLNKAAQQDKPEMSHNKYLLKGKETVSLKRNNLIFILHSQIRPACARALRRAGVG